MVQRDCRRCLRLCPLAALIPFLPAMERRRHGWDVPVRLCVVCGRGRTAIDPRARARRKWTALTDQESNGLRRTDGRAAVATRHILPADVPQRAGGREGRAAPGQHPRDVVRHLLDFAGIWLRDRSVKTPPSLRPSRSRPAEPVRRRFILRGPGEPAGTGRHGSHPRTARCALPHEQSPQATGAAGRERSELREKKPRPGGRGQGQAAVSVSSDRVSFDRTRRVVSSAARRAAITRSCSSSVICA
ncbi:hypothetical protein C8J29_11116 [Cereibacter johrii]|uniref:4Fe-4S ferredoxin-type domain-containing protein n=1 Tax=Cereibacter johrii TaxID=445629 RepID=A0ABX5J3L5_9RHOB|nr:hypothetical protein C8J29_11116 [Cereibacter johrii]